MKDQSKITPDDPDFERQSDMLLLYLKRTRGIDLSGYKRPSLMRRIMRRMEAVKIQGVERYIDYLEVHPEEFAQLFNYLLINVTAFFRDQPAWNYLNETILPKLIDAKPPESVIRVWSAGCASGQEPYSIAMLLCEHLGMDTFQKRVKVYASDMDPEALHEARQAVYTANDVEAVPPPLLQKYFERTQNRYVVQADVRRAVIFGRHDLVSDAPISRLDLLVCRNTLMYFNAEMQDHILARFHFALNETGYLLLGKAEMLLTHANLFTPIDLKHRIFAKSTNLGVRDRLRVLHHVGEEAAAHRLAQQLRVRDLSFNIAPYPHLIVDVEGNVALANEQARAAFGLRPDDIGRPFRDLNISYRPLELRGPLEQAFAGRKMVRVPNVERPEPDPAMQQFEVEIVPLIEDDNIVIGASLTFRDVSETVKLQGELDHSKQELQTAYEELQSTNEELETTNEELQSTVEELETTNEELQSTNEELETMNEELQSTNEELHTVNAELGERTDALQQASVFQEAILASLESGVVVLDEDLTVVLWNHQIADLWGLRSDEAKGKSFASLDIGLPVAELAGPIHTSINTGNHQTVTLNCVNRRGKPIVCRVTCSPLRDADSRIHGVLLFMEEEQRKDDAATT
ncbi:MAG TPA: CheR family methyltransferase [Nitrospiraceae bacterium]|nr:CheR family methyltransferase [Nitrospiraceae bacterium]